MMHIMKDGTEIPIKELGDAHLKNIIAKLRSRGANRKVVIYEDEFRRRGGEQFAQHQLDEITKTLRDLCERVANLETRP